MRRRRRAHGLTMVEILVTVAILGLLVAVFLLWLRPDDDRRCRLEAQRLAAYLIETEASAIMRDGPVRAAFSFADNHAKREFRRSGAALTDMAWELDKKATTHSINQPVKLDTVETPLAGAVKAGRAWINFNGARTPGAVAVLSLNEAVYSVLVPPRGQGEIKVHKGRASLKDPKTFKWAAPGSFPDLALSPEGGGGENPPLLAGGAPPSRSIPPPNPGPEGAQPEPEPLPDVEPATNEPPPTPPDNAPPLQPEDEPQPEEEPEEDPDAECNTHADCMQTMGERGRCVGGPNGEPNQQDPSQNRCRADLSGLGFRVRSAQVTQPDGFAGLMNPVINSYINNGHLNLVVYLQQRISWEPSNDGYNARYLSWSFNANSNTSSVVAPHPEFPTSRADSTYDQSCAPPYTSCHNIISQEQTEAGDAQQLQLWLPRVGSVAQNECAFQLLEVVGTLSVSVNTVDNNSTSPAYVRLLGNITEDSARRLKIKLPGMAAQTMKNLFLDNNIPMGGPDRNGDGLVNDGWQIAFEGPAMPVGVVGNLEGARSNNPCLGYDD